MNRTIQLMVLTVALCAGCESTPMASLNELEQRDGLVYLKDHPLPFTGKHTERNPKIVLRYKNGRFHGQCEQWYNARQQFSNTEWDNGKLLNGFHKTAGEVECKPDGDEEDKEGHQQEDDDVVAPDQVLRLHKNLSAEHLFLKGVDRMGQ